MVALDPREAPFGYSLGAGVALVFASGYGSLVEGAAGLAVRVLTKPFTDLQLQQAVEAALMKG